MGLKGEPLSCTRLPRVKWGLHFKGFRRFGALGVEGALGV